MKFFVQFFLLVLVGPLGALAVAIEKQSLDYKLVYDVRFSVEEAAALVKISIDNSALVRFIDFNLEGHQLENIEANGKLTTNDQRLEWVPPAAKAWMKYKVKLDHQRENGGYDAKVTPNWAVFRGDDLVPPAKSRFVAGAKANSIIRFNLPKGWHSVNTGWQRLTNENSKRDAEFQIENSETQFDRPVGWIIAGDIGTRRELIGDTWVSASAPVGEDFRRMDILTFLHMVWPNMQLAFKKLPEKILLVGAGDPFWKGGLSGPQSLFLHAQRPLVSENGTSTLIHEMVHVISGIRGKAFSDWIAEGLAEFYSVELLYRAGGISDSRRERILAELDEWSANVTRLNVRNSTGPITAKATLFFFALDDELRQVSGNKMTMDNLTQQLMKKEKVDAEDLRKTFVLLTGKKSQVITQWGEQYFPKAK